jgi:two-component system response regulator HydG
MHGDPSCELLTLATEPGVGLGTVLDHAVAALGAEGGADAAALLVFDPAEARPRLVAAALSGAVEAPVRQRLQPFWEGDRLARVWSTGEPDRISVSRGGTPPAAGYEPLIAHCRSSLWIPLVEHRRPVGLLALETLSPGAFPDTRVRRIEEAARQALPGIQRALLRHWLHHTGAPVDVVGASPAFLDLERQIRLAGTVADGAVLVTGERGSGKELVAWAIHAWSRRRERPLVPLLGAACAESLTADEFQLADGGTLLLDEAGDLPPVAQAAFLRVLERGELQRIGRDAPLRVDVRVVAATNRDLAALMAEGRFRHDLYDRLSFFEIQIPPLRERAEDVPALARYFLRSTCASSWRRALLDRQGICGACHRPSPTTACASREFYRALERYPWPGNVRELRQTMERLVATVSDDVLDLRHLPAAVRATLGAGDPREDSAWSLDAAVRRHIEKALHHTRANQSETARLLGLPLSTLRSKMKRLGVRPGG